jgi:hypothetical protein
MRYRFKLVIVEVSEQGYRIVQRSDVEEEYPDALALAQALAVFARQQSGVDGIGPNSLYHGVAPLFETVKGTCIPLPPIEDGYGRNTRVVIAGIEQLS